MYFKTVDISKIRNKTFEEFKPLFAEIPKHQFPTRKVFGYKNGEVRTFNTIYEAQAWSKNNETVTVALTDQQVAENIENNNKRSELQIKYDKEVNDRVIAAFVVQGNSQATRKIIEMLVTKILNSNTRQDIYDSTPESEDNTAVVDSLLDVFIVNMLKLYPDL